MRHSLQLEAIGDDRVAFFRSHGVRAGRSPWVAEITGVDPRYGFARRFLPGAKDYSRANRIGSRGVYVCYALEGGRIYEIFELLTRTRTRRYFCRYTKAGRQVLSAEEVLACLTSNTASASMS
jgi:hypothetical protein